MESHRPKIALTGGDGDDVVHVPTTTTTPSCFFFFDLLLTDEFAPSYLIEV
jgi:hypothetical protein